MFKKYEDQEYDAICAINERKKESYQKQSPSLQAIDELERKLDHELAAMDEKIQKIKELIP